MVAGVIYLVLMILGWILVGVDSTGYGGFGLAGTSLLVVPWVISFVHGLVIRQQALDLFAFDDEPHLKAARHNLTVRLEAQDVVKRQPNLAAEAGIGRDTAAFGGLVDVNHATAAEFASLPGFTQQLGERVVEVRTRVDGFDSVLDFAHVLDLPAHLVDNLRDRLICLPW